MRCKSLGLGWTSLSLAVVALLGPAAAQTLPQSGADPLLVPPELRQGAPAATAATEPRKVRRNTSPQTHAAPQAATSSAAKLQATHPHPVDFGVVMRGGSATSRIYSPTGTSEAVQESGSAFGAGMRLGF